MLMKHEIATIKEMLEEHLPYEFDMFFYAWDKLCKLAEIKEKKLEEEKQKNMSLEVFLLHARNLIEFFCDNPNEDYYRLRDILPVHLIKKYNIDKEFSKVRWSINNHLSHISKKRSKVKRHFTDNNNNFSALLIFKVINDRKWFFQEDIKTIYENNQYMAIHKSYMSLYSNTNLEKITALEGQTSCSPNIVGSGITGNI